MWELENLKTLAKWKTTKEREGVQQIKETNRENKREREREGGGGGEERESEREKERKRERAKLFEAVET